MLKKNKLLTLCLSSLLGISCLVGCGGGKTSSGTNNPSSSPKTSETNSEYTVSFYVDSVLYGERQVVKSGSKVEKPADPTREADEEYTYTFNGWYENGSNTAWNFETDVVTKNLDLFAEFDSNAISYDLIVWVYGINGATEPETYISLDESNRMRDAYLEIAQDKKVSWQYFEYLTNDAFNAQVLSKKIKPDVIVSGAKMTGGNNPLTMNESYPRTSVGKGWFNNTSRYVGIYEACDANLEMAIAAYEMIKGNGPDYFALDSESITLKAGESREMVATLNAGDERTLTYASLDTNVATVENNVITAVGEGSTTVTATLGYVTTNIEVTVIANLDYELVVWVYGVNGAKEPTTYITFDESERMKSEFLKLDVAKDKEILWNYVEGLVNADFNAAVNGANPAVDVVISGNKLDNDDVCIACHSTYGKVRVGEGWFENTGRRVAVTANCEDHLELAVALYDLVRNVGPDAEFAMSEEAITIDAGTTYTLSAPAYNQTVTWSSSDESVATVENGVVTAVAAGTATITAKDENNNEVTCVVTVTAAPVVDPYGLVVYVYGAGPSTTYISKEESEALKEAFVALNVIGDKELVWTYIEGIKNAPFNETVNAADPKADVVFSGNKIDNDEVVVALSETYGKVKVGAGWVENTSRYVAITASCNAHLDAALALYNLASTAKPTEDNGDEGGEVNPNPEAYDLVVYTYLAASKSTYITADEYAAIKEAFTKEGAPGYGKNILWVEYSGGNQDALGTFIASANEGEGPDVIIARSGIKTGKVGALTIDESTYTNVKTSWTENDGNYVAITGTAKAENVELGKALITMLGADKA